VALTYLMPLELASLDERVGYEPAMKGARAQGKPFISFFTSAKMRQLAQDAGFKEAHSASAAQSNPALFHRQNRRPPSCELGRVVG
jgi:O-methyltransferase involved in polyketide biosynthesis